MARAVPAVSAPVAAAPAKAARADARMPEVPAARQVAGPGPGLNLKAGAVGEVSIAEGLQLTALRPAADSAAGARGAGAADKEEAAGEVVGAGGSGQNAGTATHARGPAADSSTHVMRWCSPTVAPPAAGAGAGVFGGQGARQRRQAALAAGCRRQSQFLSPSPSPSPSSPEGQITESLKQKCM